MNSFSNSDLLTFNDGDIISSSLVSDWELDDYCVSFNQKNIVSFVGFVLKRGKLLISFPKHFDVKNFSDKQKMQSIKEIISIISMGKTVSGSFESQKDDEFPLKDYKVILNYYKSFGLYSSNEKIESRGYSGRINWNKTINKTRPAIIKNNILFIPPIIDSKIQRNVFISECMEYVLHDAFNNYNQLLSFLQPYKLTSYRRQFENHNHIYQELNRIRNNYFKDTEKSLIASLINYFKWKSTNSNDAKMLTMNFENYWEAMVNVYLNRNLYEIKENQLLFLKDVQKYHFKKPGFEYVESDYTRGLIRDSSDLGFRIQFDHISINKDVIYMFDSKYIKESFDSLNYKQVFYAYFLKQKWPNAFIHNGLIAPTSGEYDYKVHIDRQDLDGIKIIEHYLPLKDVLETLKNNKEDLKYTLNSRFIYR